MKNYKGNQDNYNLLKEMVSSVDGKIVEPKAKYGSYLSVEIAGKSYRYSTYSGIETAILELFYNPSINLNDEIYNKVNEFILNFESDETLAYKMLYDEGISLDGMYDLVLLNEIGSIDNVNDRETVEMYIKDMIDRGVYISHMLKTLEDYRDIDLFEISLDNSMNTPYPIETKRDLLDALF